jgi:hypothetical protein
MKEVERLRRMMEDDDVKLDLAADDENVDVTEVAFSEAPGPPVHALPETLPPPPELSGLDENVVEKNKQNKQTMNKEKSSTKSKAKQRSQQNSNQPLDKMQDYEIIPQRVEQGLDGATDVQKSGLVVGEKANTKLSKRELRRARESKKAETQQAQATSLVRLIRIISLCTLNFA